MKRLPAVLDGTGTNPKAVFTECGSFYNKGDNRIARSVVKEDICSGTVTSLSFSPQSWLCSSGPVRHPILKKSGSGTGGRGEPGRGGGGDGRVAIVLSDQNFPACLPAVSGKCLVVIRQEDALLSDLGLLLAKTVGKDFAIPKGSVVLVGSLTHLLKQGEVSYAMASVRESKRFAGLFNNNVKTIPFIPIPLAGTDNPTLIRRMVDTSLWLESLDQYCLSSYHTSLRKLITDSFGPANRTVHYMSELSLPATLDTYDTKNVMLPGWQNLPAALAVLTAKKEHELVTCLLKDVNSVFYTGLDENPNLSRSASRPLSKVSQEKKKTSTEATLTVGGSNATRLAEALANLGIDSYKLATPGWKLNKENAEKIVTDLKEILETIPKDAPVIFFCMDNTVFKVATAEGELTNISKCVAEDDGFHINGSLVVAPDFFIRTQIDLLRTLVSYCEGHTVLIMCPVPRYATFRCCDDPSHCTNFDDPSYLSTLIGDLARVKISITKGIPEATAVDTLEVLIGQGSKTMEAKEEVVKSCWSQDPVHANLHAYFKLASNTIQLIESGLKDHGATSGKRPRSNSTDDQRGSVSGSGPNSVSGSGSGNGIGAGSAAKRQKFPNRHDHRDRTEYGTYGAYDGSYGGSGGGGTQGTRGGGRPEYRYDKGDYHGNYYGSGYPRQHKDDNYFPHRGEHSGRRFQGRRPYGGGRGRF
jgi:hypothetical protein